MKAQSDPPDSLVFECDLAAPPEKVWRALTEPRLLEAWLRPDDPSLTEYEILTAEPHRLLRYGWRDRQHETGDSGGREVHSVVTVELAPAPLGGTHLRLTHGQFRIVPAAPSVTASSVGPVRSARRRRAPATPCFAPPLWRRAA